MEYKGYVGSIEYSEVDGCYHGRVMATPRSILTYEGQDVTSLTADFRETVDEYLELCNNEGWTPETPSL